MNVVTGAFGFSGKYITRQLLFKGEKVKTVTSHPQKKNPFGEQVKAFPYNFNQPDELSETLRGAEILYNTYWIRFPYGDVNFDSAVNNSRILFESARKAGVKRIVHISVTNPDEKTSLPYFRGKAIVERLIQESGLSYAIIRPTLIYGKEDILINNIAWCLRRFPIFGVFGDGKYRVQPIYAEDLAKVAIEAAHSDENMVIDAAGPEIFTFEEMVRLIKKRIGSKAKIMHVPAWLALNFSRMVGILVKDVVLTKDEAEGLMRDLLYSREAPRGTTKLGDWLEENRERVGVEYASEVRRHYQRE
jgi:NADH dehydrogenase